MVEFFSTTEVQLILLLMVLASLVAIGFYLIGRVRQESQEDRQTASDLLTEFRDLHGEGKLSDQEFRTIKGILANRLQPPPQTDSGEE